MIRYRRDTTATPLGAVDRTIMVVTLVLCLTFGVSALAYIYQQQQNIQEVGERFDRLKSRVLAEVALRMRLYEYGLQGTRGMMAAVGEEFGAGRPVGVLDADDRVGDREGHLDRQERADEVQHGAQTHGELGCQRLRRDGRRHRVGRVMETIGEVEGQCRHDGQHQQDQLRGHITKA